MRLKEAVASALHLLVVISFLGIALFCLALPSMPLWRMACMNWLVEQPEQFYWLGAIFGGAAILFIYGFYSVGRGRFLRLLMKPHIAIVDTKLLKEVIEECFHAHFPRQVRGADVAINKQRLDVAVDLLPLEETRELLLMREMEKHLVHLLRQRFGYTKPFILSIRSR